MANTTAALLPPVPHTRLPPLLIQRELRVSLSGLVKAKFSDTDHFSPLGLLDAFYGTSKNFKRMMAEAEARHNGDYHKASHEVLSSLARWEADREERDREKTAVGDVASDSSASDRESS